MIAGKGLAAAALLLAGASTAPQAPVRWTPDAISTPGYEASPTFSPDGSELIYLSADARFRGWHLLMSRCIDGAWSKPAPPSFAGPAGTFDADAGYTPDGKGIYFVSTRHDPKGEDFDIYHAARSPDGSFAAPVRLPAPVNSPQSELLPRVDAAGTLYFGSSRPGGHGQSDIYVAQQRDGAWQVRNLGSPVSTAANEYEAEVSRDGNTLILVADRGDRSHLYHFRKQGGAWRETGRIPARADVFQVGPLLSPDADKLLFAQASADRSGEFYLTDLKPGSREPWPPRCGVPAGSKP
ncbi:TolB family protein [Sphingomonas koreensis]|uniref:TolB family protein n=1 Tax=Sphingomonas koreensis TaxID=93064 RepID=UPI0013E002B4|nr:PD40 domain-containing protein [Sphingomonas koreensis]